jgi:hypothetical protein
MDSLSPITRGLRLLFLRPAIPLAEVAWRWSFAVAFWFLTAMLLVEYAGSLPVDVASSLLLGTGQPDLVGRALHRIFSGSTIRLGRGAIVFAITMTILWVGVASLGRLATLKALGEEFGGPAPTRAGRPARLLGSLLALNFFRTALRLASVVAALGALLLVSSIWARTKVSLSDSARLGFALIVLVWLPCTVLNWFLATAAIFVVCRHRPALAAIASLVELCHSRLSSVAMIGICFGVAHIGALILAFAFGSIAFSLAGVIGMLAALPIAFLVAVVYFAVADFLYTGRLAAYLALIQGGEEFDLSRAELPPGTKGQIDQSELILSDAPLYGS